MNKSKKVSLSKRRKHKKKLEEKKKAQAVATE
jgi:hypothetical protein